MQISYLRGYFKITWGSALAQTRDHLHGAQPSPKEIRLINYRSMNHSPAMGCHKLLSVSHH